MIFRDDIIELSFMCIYGRFLYRMNLVFVFFLICSFVRSNLYVWLGIFLFFCRSVLVVYILFDFVYLKCLCYLKKEERKNGRKGN